jgi:hypothetical protein
MNNQGRRANTCGGALENIVKGIFSRKNFISIPYHQWIKNPAKYRDEVLIRNYPFTSIYGHKGNTEFYLLSKRYGCNIRIECKWQQVTGSVDEKYPYLYLNCIEAMPEKDIIILVDGGGYKLKARLWLKEAISERKYQTNTEKNIQLFDIKEFMIWSNNTFA